MRETKDVAILDLSGRFALGGVEELSKHVRELVNTNRRNIILNLQNLRYIDSTGIGALVAASQIAKNAGVKIFLVRPKRQLLPSEWSQLIPILSYDSEAEALHVI